MRRNLWALGILAFAAIQANAADHSADIISTAASTGSFKTLTNALVASGLLDALKADGPFTVLAPSDAAFDKLPSGTLERLLKPGSRDQLVKLLKYHVVQGSVTSHRPASLTITTLSGDNLAITIDAHRRIKVNDATVVQADIRCRNGTIQVIDSVLTPPSAESGKGVLALAAKAGKFKTLLAAIQAAGLTEALEGEGPFTILAPTDEAFAKLPAGTVEKLLKAGNRQQLAAILKYHVVSGRLTARQVLRAGSATTLQGQAIHADLTEGRLTINGVNVINTDLQASNGIVHVIDRVLIPG